MLPVRVVTKVTAAIVIISAGVPVAAIGVCLGVAGASLAVPVIGGCFIAKV